MKNSKQENSDHCEPDSYTFSILIDLYSKVGNHEKAAAFIQEMIDKGLNVDCVYFHSIMNSAKVKGDVDATLKYYSLMEKSGVDPNTDTFNILMSLYGFRGELGKVEETVNEMENRHVLLDRYSIGTLVRIYGDNGEYEKAKIWYSQLKKRGMYPTSAIINTMMRITMLQKSGLDDTKFYYDLAKKLGIVDIAIIKDFALCLLINGIEFGNVVESFLNESKDIKMNLKSLYLFVDAVLRPESLKTVHLNPRLKMPKTEALVSLNGKAEFEILLEKAKADGVLIGDKFAKEINLVQQILMKFRSHHPKASE